MKNDLISMNDLDLARIESFLDLAQRVESMPLVERVRLLPGRVLMVMFYEPSTRTRLSFESAMQKLGGGVIGFSETASTSVAKGESFADTILTCERYADAIVVRHPKEGTARLAAETASVPVINAGDGTNQHPTQTLLDLYTIKKFHGQVDNVRISFVGDLKYSRTVHSLFQALLKYDGVKVNLVSPQTLRLPGYLKLSAEGKKLAFDETEDLQGALAQSDIVYMTRIQAERFADIMDYEKVKNAYCLDASMLVDAPDHLKVLHPLPRVNEISPDVDGTHFAGYFDQVESGVIVRQAILLNLLGVMS
jgi:aspartate carbamoyltransferase catalytic subunit